MNELHPYELQDDSYGPGADLILSLLAVTLLLLALVGTGAYYARQEGNLIRQALRASPVPEEDRAVRPDLQWVDTQAHAEALETIETLEQQVETLQNRLIKQQEAISPDPPARESDRHARLIGEYAVTLGDLIIPSRDTALPALRPVSREIIRRMLADMQRAFQAQGESSKFRFVRLEGNIPMELIHYFPKETPQRTFISTFYDTGYRLIARYQQYLIGKGVPMRCIESVSRGFDVQEGYIGTVASQKNGPQAVKEASAYIKLMPAEEIRRAQARIRVYMVEDYPGATAWCDRKAFTTIIRRLYSAYN